MRYRPLLMVEFNNHERFFPILKALGYTMYYFDAKSRNLRSFVADGHPLNIFAIHKKGRNDVLASLPLPLI